MAKLSKTEAARQLHISRTTLYKLIDQGKLSSTPEGLIDSTELVRAAPYVDTLKERTRTSTDTAALDAHQSAVEHDEQPVNTVHEQAWTTVHEREQTSTIQDLVDTVREQMQMLRAEIQAAREERQAAREREAVLLRMVEQMQHRYDRLLEAPRRAPGVEARPTETRQSAASRGEIRRRIMELLQEHPEGLSPAQTRQLLGIEKYLADTMHAMVRDGLLRRGEMGRYVSV